MRWPGAMRRSRSTIAIRSIAPTPTALGELVAKYPADDDIAAMYSRGVDEHHAVELLVGFNDAAAGDRAGDRGARSRRSRAARSIRWRCISTSTPWKPRRRRTRPRRRRTRSHAACRDSGHLVHMPAHIYWRVGRYNDAARGQYRGGEGGRGLHRPVQRAGLLSGDVLSPQHPLPVGRVLDAGPEQGGDRGGAQGRRQCAPRADRAVPDGRVLPHHSAAGAGAVRPLGRNPGRAAAARRSRLFQRHLALCARRGVRQQGRRQGRKGRTGAACSAEGERQGHVPRRQ